MNKLQFQHCLSASEEVLKFEYPTENVLLAYFKKHPKLGAKDRQLVGDVLFTLLRHFESIRIFLEKKNTLSNQLICAYLLFCEKKNIDLTNTEFATDEQINLATQYKQWRATSVNQNIQAQTELPSWLLEKLSFLSKEKLQQFAETLNSPSTLDFRVNTLKSKRDKVVAQLQAEGLSAAATPYSPWGVRFDEKFPLNKHPLFQNGTIEVQDEGSQLLALISGAKRNELVVDFCAGAGGKSLAMGAMMANTGRLYAMDVSEYRLRNIKPRLERSGLNNITLQQIAHEKDDRIKKLIGKADRVLVDAPCSGLGTLKRHPDLKYRQSIDTIEEIKQTQASILIEAASLVKKGGTLIYATCSILPEENEQQIEKFLQEQPEFDLIPIQTILEKCKIALSMTQYLNLSPADNQTDGFFAAVMIRNKQHTP